MAPSDDIRVEIGGLKDDLSRRSDRNSGPSKSEDAPEPDLSDELTMALRELRTTLEDAAADAETLLSEHPLAVTAAAFCLGFVVGRLLGHRS